MENKTLAQVPSDLNRDDNLKRFLQELTEVVDVLQGNRGTDAAAKESSVTAVLAELTKIKSRLNSLEVRADQVDTVIAEILEAIEIIEDILSKLYTTLELNEDYYDLEAQVWEKFKGLGEFEATGAELVNCPFEVDATKTYTVYATSIKSLDSVWQEFTISEGYTKRKYFRLAVGGKWTKIDTFDTVKLGANYVDLNYVGWQTLEGMYEFEVIGAELVNCPFEAETATVYQVYVSSVKTLGSVWQEFTISDGYTKRKYFRLAVGGKWTKIDTFDTVKLGANYVDLNYVGWQTLEGMYEFEVIGAELVNCPFEVDTAKTYTVYTTSIKSLDSVWQEFTISDGYTERKYFRLAVNGKWTKVDTFDTVKLGANYVDLNYVGWQTLEGMYEFEATGAELVNCPFEVDIAKTYTVYATSTKTLGSVWQEFTISDGYTKRKYFRLEVGGKWTKIDTFDTVKLGANYVDLNYVGWQTLEGMYEFEAAGTGLVNFPFEVDVAKTYTVYATSVKSLDSVWQEFTISDSYTKRKYFRLAVGGKWTKIDTFDTVKLGANYVDLNYVGWQTLEGMYEFEATGAELVNCPLEVETATVYKVYVNSIKSLTLVWQEITIDDGWTVDKFLRTSVGGVWNQVLTV